MADEKRLSWIQAELRMLPSQAWIVLMLIGLPDGIGAAVALLGMSLAPGINFGFALCRGSWTKVLVAACCLSPLCAAIAGYLACGHGLDLRWAALAPLVISMPLAGLSAFFPRKEENDSDKETESGLRVALGISVILVAISGWMLMTSPNLRLSSHGLLHSSIAYQVIDSGLPPQNPFFAGETLIYYWIYHLIAAGLSLGSGLSPLFAFAFLDLLAIAAVVPLLFLTGRALGLKKGVSLLGGLIGLLALNPLGPIFFLIQEHSVTLDHIRAGAVPTSLLHYQALGFDFRLASPLSKFWNVSSFPSGVSLFLFGFYVAVVVFESRLQRFVLLLITFCGLMLINPLVGLCFGLPMGAASLVGLVNANTRKENVINLGAMAVGGGISLVYLLSITSLAEGEGSSFASIRPNLPALMGILLAAGPVCIFAGAGAIMMACKKTATGEPARDETSGEKEAEEKTDNANRIRAIQLATACLVLIAMALLLSLPMENEYKIIRLLIFPAGVLAGPAASLFLQRLRLPKAVAALLVVAAIVPNSVIAVVIYANAMEAQVPLDDKRLQLSVTSDDSEKQAAYAFLRERTPEDAIVVVDAKDHESAMGGKMQGDEVPALARRVLYAGHRFYLTENHAGLADRLERVARLYLDQPGPLPEPIDGRPLFVLVRSGKIPSALGKSPYKEVFRKGKTAVFQYLTTDK